MFKVHDTIMSMLSYFTNITIQGYPWKIKNKIPGDSRRFPGEDSTSM